MGWGSSKPKKPDPTPQERELARVGVQYQKRFEERFVPAADRLLDLTAANESGSRAFTRQAESEAASAFGGAGTAGQMLQAGGYGSGAARSISDLSNARATAVGGAAAEGDRAMRARDLRSRMRVASLYRGIGDNATLAMGNAGQRATSAALAEGQRRLDLSQGIASGVASGIGMYGASQGWFDGSGGD